MAACVRVFGTRQTKSTFPNRLLTHQTGLRADLGVARGLEPALEAMVEHRLIDLLPEVAHEDIDAAVGCGQRRSCDVIGGQHRDAAAVTRGRGQWSRARSAVRALPEGW